MLIARGIRTHTKNCPRTGTLP